MSIIQKGEGDLSGITGINMGIAGSTEIDKAHPVLFSSHVFNRFFNSSFHGVPG